MTPVFDEMMSQSLLKNNLFAFWVGSNPELTLGYYDSTKFKGDIHWIPVELKFQFGLKLDDIKINGKPLNICKDAENCLVNIDSGQTVNSFPSFAHEVLKANKLPADGFSVACQNPSEFGEMAMVIGGKDFVIPNNDWVTPPGSLM